MSTMFNLFAHSSLVQSCLSWYLILQHTVMHILLYFIFCALYLIFYSFYFMHTSLVLYSTIFALSMERTWLTFHCWLYNLCIVVYVTNKTWTWTLNLNNYGCILFLLLTPSETLISDLWPIESWFDWQLFYQWFYILKPLTKCYIT